MSKGIYFREEGPGDQVEFDPDVQILDTVRIKINYKGLRRDIWIEPILLEDAPERVGETLVQALRGIITKSRKHWGLK